MAFLKGVLLLELGILALERLELSDLALVSLVGAFPLAQLERLEFREAGLEKFFGQPARSQSPCRAHRSPSEVDVKIA